MSNEGGQKIHGDKLEPDSAKKPDQQPSAGQSPALPDNLKAVDLESQTESLKVHGDKIEPHSSSHE